MLIVTSLILFMKRPQDDLVSRMTQKIPSSSVISSTWIVLLYPHIALLSFLLRSYPSVRSNQFLNNHIILFMEWNKSKHIFFQKVSRHFSLSRGWYCQVNRHKNDLCLYLLYFDNSTLLCYFWYGTSTYLYLITAITLP